MFRNKKRRAASLHSVSKCPLKIVFAGIQFDMIVSLGIQLKNID